MVYATNMARGSLSLQQERFIAAYVGEANGNATRAAEIAEYRFPNKQGPALLVNLGIQQRIAAARAEIAAEGVANLQNRMNAYNDRWQKARALMAARAQAFAGRAPGADTGLLAEVVKIAANGDTVSDFQVDTNLLRELRELERQAAIETGQWEEPGTRDPVGVRILVGVNVNAL